jgi:chromosome segregation ATPase
MSPITRNGSTNPKALQNRVTTLLGVNNKLNKKITTLKKQIKVQKENLTTANLYTNPTNLTNLDALHAKLADSVCHVSRLSLKNEEKRAKLFKQKKVNRSASNLVDELMKTNKRLSQRCAKDRQEKQNLNRNVQEADARNASASELNRRASQEIESLLKQVKQMQEQISAPQTNNTNTTPTPTKT